MTFFEHMQHALSVYSEHHTSFSACEPLNDDHATSHFSFDFDEGIPGFREDKKFELSIHPTLQGCFYLKSTTNPHVTFLALPLDPQKGPIDKEDLIEASRSLKVRFEDCAFLSLISIRRDESGPIAMTINLKAPLVFDLKSRRGKQVVLSNTYALDHLLTSFIGNDYE